KDEHERGCRGDAAEASTPTGTNPERFGLLGRDHQFHVAFLSAGIEEQTIIRVSRPPRMPPKRRRSKGRCGWTSRRPSARGRRTAGPPSEWEERPAVAGDRPGVFRSLPPRASGPIRRSDYRAPGSSGSWGGMRPPAPPAPPAPVRGTLRVCRNLMKN